MSVSVASHSPVGSVSLSEYDFSSECAVRSHCGSSFPND